MSETRNWTELPLELLQKIAGHLSEIPDLFRFRSVCVSWRSASKSIPNLPPQLPWLLLPSDNLYPRCRFFSAAENRIYALPFPEHYFDEIFPCSSGWVIIGKGANLSLLNLMTRSSSPLPRLPGLPSRKVKLFGSDLVVACYRNLPTIRFCRIGEETWKEIDTSPCLPYGDFSYHNGMFFVFNWYGEQMCVFDARTLQRVREIPMDLESCDGHLVESPSGMLLLVVRNKRGTGKRFDVFGLCEDGQEMRWGVLANIGDNTLFVDADHAMCFPSGKGCRGNCIYFADYHKLGYMAGRRMEDYRVRLFDIWRGRVEAPIVSAKSSRFSGEAMWFVPSLHTSIPV